MTHQLNQNEIDFIEEFEELAKKYSIDCVTMDILTKENLDFRVNFSHIFGKAVYFFVEAKEFKNEEAY